MLISVDDYHRAACKLLTKNAFDYYDSGARDEHTLRENRAAYQRIGLRPRVLVDVSVRDASLQLFGQTIKAPILVAPTAFHKMAAPEGEAATARAAKAAQTIMVLSSLSNTAVEEVCAQGAAVWFQLYVYKDREATRALVQRAEAAGAKALVVTVDAPRLGFRERDVRNRFHLPEGLSVENLLPVGYGEVAEQQAESGLAAYFKALIDPSLSWKDIAWLRSITKLPLVIKGLMRDDDARKAVDAGVDAVVVSNHGGRQVDGALATIEALPEVAKAVNGRIPVIVDGGIRRGSDVLKALALGATAVLVGRPILWGLAVEQEAGALAILRMLQDELDLAMTLCGCPDLASITPDLVKARD